MNFNNIKKLQQKKYRDEFEMFVIEGYKMLEEAIKTKQKIVKLYICTDILNNSNIYDLIKGYEFEEIDIKSFNELSSTVTPQGILAVIEKNNVKSQTLSNSKFGSIILILDNVQDPGNIGTIIRTADACGVDEIILSTGCADIYNPKVLRSTMGSIFRANITTNVEIENKIIELQKEHYQVYTTVLDGEINLFDCKFADKTVIVVGNESNGISDNILSLADIKLKIPMTGKIESLNASVATGVVLYEVFKQNTKKRLT